MSISGLIFFRTLRTTIYSTVILSLCAWIVQSSRYFALLSTNNVSLSIFIEFISYLSIDIVAVILPIALAVSVAFVYHRFIRSNQMIAVQAIGGSPISTLKPVLALVGIVIGYLYVSNMWISPYAWSNFRKLEFNIRNHITLPENSGRLFTNDKFSIYAQKYTGRFVFENLFIIDSRNPDKKNVFYARSGTIKNNLLILSEGEFAEINNVKHTKSISSFRTYTHDLSKLLQSGNHHVHANEKYVTELLSDIDDDLLSDDVRAYSRAMLHQKITSPLLSLVFALIMFIFVALAPHSRCMSLNRTIIGLAAVIVIQGLYFWVANLATSKAAFIFINYVLISALLLIQLIVLIRIKYR